MQPRSVSLLRYQAEYWKARGNVDDLQVSAARLLQIINYTERGRKETALVFCRRWRFAEAAGEKPSVSARIDRRQGGSGCGQGS